MYKVFINEKVICFTNSRENLDNYSNVLVLHFFQRELIPTIIELLSIQSKTNAVIVLSDNFENDFETFTSYFKIIKAAGGVVTNSDNKFLIIYRLEKWDLPKGKIEDNESIEDAAIREVEEECGVNSIKLKGKLPQTFHIYFHKEKYVLKETYWFSMETNYSGDLIPQENESITKAVWMTKNEIKEKVYRNTYNSIISLLENII